MVDGLKLGKGRFCSTLSRGTLSRKQRLLSFLIVCQSIQGGKDHASACYIYTKRYHVTRFFFPKDDEILLDYLNEDGQKIEPTWYMPTIPTVLVNGSKGIGTG